MSDKLTITELASLQNQTSAINIINNNFDLIAEKLDTLLSRDGDTPNQMEASLDMNSNRITNLPTPVNATEPARKTDLDSIVSEGIFDGDKGDITVSSSGTIWSIDEGAVTNVKRSDMAQATISGRAAGAGTGARSDLTASQVRDILDGLVKTRCATRTALKAFDTTKVTVAYLSESGREGTFAFLAGDYSTHVAADTAEGVYVKADAIAATAGCWVRMFNGPIFGEWFGAVGDNSTNNYTAINVAKNVCQLRGGGSIVYGPGKFAFGTKVTISDTTPVFISGMGRGVTIFRQTSATEGGFKWANSTLYANDGLYACTVEAGAGLDASGFTGTGSTGTGLEAERVNDGYTARGVSIHNFARSLRVEGTWNSVFDDLRLLHAQEENILIGGDGAIAIAGGNKFTNIKASNNGFTGTNTASVGVRIRQSGGDFFLNIDCTSQANGIKIDPASGKQVAYCFFNAVLADTNVNDGWRIDGSAGAVVGCKAMGCWGSYATTGNGLYIDGANVDGFEFIGHSLRENGYRGAYVGADCRNITFVAPQVARNSKNNSNFYAGIEFAANASKAQIIGGRLGNFASGLAHEQAEGILIGAGATEITITGPDVGNPGTGKSGLVNNSTSATVIITGVRPIQLGYSKSVETTLNINSRGTIAAGSTVYLGIGASSATESDVRGIIGRSCVLTQVTIGVTVAPGSAKNFTYTVFKNGVATAMTGTITGAASYTLTLTGAITYGSLDNFSIQLVTDAASGVAVHQAIMYFDR